MWERLIHRLRQQGMALVTALVVAMTVVDRRTPFPSSVPPIVLHLDLLTFLSSGQQRGRVGSELSVPPCWLN
ncbi:MAG: hypothetical protein NZ473_00165 [Candidatus Kapabacteria bacterium]|nr:hypothetical protein [Candidatus Kapabacteria bacterium]MCS7169530.1 hypothetical protein [Candidatus Kapabacteria bacterium]MDW7997643.1 hypothetical protein [Bacteroidota bacterium]MDW8224626.1 hypothetical protein [Bacteroidota bacterium]